MFTKIWEKGKKKIRLIISLLIAALGIYMAIFPWYLSIDVRYTVANLQYVADQLESQGIDTGIDTHGINRLKYPGPHALSSLVDITTNWTYGYLAGLEASGVSSNQTSRLSSISPYNTLNHLAIDMVSEISKEGYEIIAYHEGITNPTTEYSSDLLKEYVETIEAKKITFTEDMKDYIRVYSEYTTIGFALLIYDIIFNILINVFKRMKRKIGKFFRTHIKNDTFSLFNNNEKEREENEN